MTVNVDTLRPLATGNGVTTAFNFAFKVFSTSQVKVYVDGVLQTTGFTITLTDGGDNGGTVTFSVAPATGAEILILRLLTLDQQTDLPVVDQLNTDNVEDMVDKCVMLIQQVDEQLDRAVTRASTSTSTASLELPDPSANAFLGWNADADALENKALADATLVVLPATGGNAGKVIAVNGGGTGYEATYIGPAQLENTAVTPGSYTQANITVDADGRITAASSGSALPKGYIGGGAPYWASTSTITFPSGLRARDSSNSADIELVGNFTASLTYNGATGLDTGSEASNTWYYAYLIRNASNGDCSVVLSATNEAVSGSISYPSGYTQKRQLPIAFRNDGSSNLMNTYVASGWPYRPFIIYNTEFPEARTSSTKSTEVLDQGTSATFAAVSCASYIPPISQLGYFYILKATSGAIGYIRPTGSGFTNGIPMQSYDESEHTIWCKTNSSQSVDYKVSSAAMDIHVAGFVVTEVNV